MVTCISFNLKPSLVALYYSSYYELYVIVNDKKNPPNLMTSFLLMKKNEVMNFSVLVFHFVNGTLNRTENINQVLNKL